MSLRAEMVVYAMLLTLMLPALPSTAATPVAPGGAGARPSVEGCMREWLFNGIWRLRVLKIEAIRKPNSGNPGTPGWGVTTEIRNGSRRTLRMRITGISGTGRGVDLVLPDGTPLILDVRDFQTIVSRNIPQGGGIVHQLKYYYPPRTPDAQVQKPTKFLLEIDPRQLRNYRTLTAGAGYTIANPSLRVRLECAR